jgi:hypothetical protein
MSEEKGKGQQTTPPARPVEKPNKESPKKVIYLGPTLFENGGEFTLKHSSIFANGLPPNIAERVKTDPDLARFFVAVDKAPAMMNKLANKDSELSQLSVNIRNMSLTRRKKAR